MDKQWYKDRIYGYECRVVEYITNALLTHTPKRKVLIDLKKLLTDLTVQVHLSKGEHSLLQFWTVNTYNKMVRKTWGRREPEVIQQEATNQYRAMEREKNLIADDIEYRYKYNYLHGKNSIINQARQSQYYSPFFLCSQHTNPAVGHKDWEGKIYYDEGWEQFIKPDNPYYDAVKNTVQNMLTVQYITGAPVYLCSRKNCRHFLKNISIDSVIKDTYKPIIVDNSQQMGYEKSQYVKYYQKLKLLKAVTSTDKISIKKARMLMKKWKLK